MRNSQLLRLVSVALTMALVGALPLISQQSEHQLRKTVTRTLELDYLLSLPEGYSDDGPAVPLVLFLHGAGERGSDLEVVKKHGPPKLVAAGQKIPAIVVSPQCPTDSWWNDRVDALIALLDEVEARYNVDPDRIYVTGLSMGGYGTWALLSAQPDRFAAAIPICGGGMTAMARRVASLPIWIFHGDADVVVPVEESERMAAALERFGSETAKLTLYPGVNHDSWTETYADPEVWSWLFAQQRSAP